MKLFTGIYITLIVGIFLAVHPGCAPSKVWVSTPENQQAVNEYFDAKFEPLRKEGKFFVAFRLSLKNKTDRELKIDWNRTQYLFKGNPHGLFIFKGINPADVRNKTIPPDTIPAGGAFVKEMAPYRLIAWTPAREQRQLAADDSLISAGLIPPGKSGIRLSVMLEGKEIVERLWVTITEKVVR